MGPHGLCVGATGSGKSELLRTLVLALLVTHPPERLNMVLVDFKGGATFAPFEGVPHVSGIITNLSDETSLITRVHESLAGEIRRRQEVLKRAGIDEAPTTLVTTSDDAINIYLTIYCRRLRPDMQIISRATLERNVSTLHRAGADFVMSYASMGANTILNVLEKGDVVMLLVRSGSSNAFVTVKLGD